MEDLDRAGFYAKTLSLGKGEMHKKLMELFKVVEFSNKELHGDYNFELAKHKAGLPSECN